MQKKARGNNCTWDNLLKLCLIANAVLVFLGGYYIATLFKEPPTLSEKWDAETATIHWVSDPVQVGIKLAERTEKNHEAGLYTIGLMVGNAKNCTIWAYEPRNENDKYYLYVLGHEVLHCFRGAYHD